ncbi:hypothetical protein [Paraflavitalea speifideaquila]|uniref:hypothetical protein n=1 Tax=Paraflavitalea speifideaquila TaxID=3076558 RepID=UPI0028ED0007|nr:hypothetical protein [Paraflavitalea speifideiaquila]
MRRNVTVFALGLLLVGNEVIAQTRDSLVVKSIVEEATKNSQLQQLAHELMDGIGPRLVGTPQMKKPMTGQWPNTKAGVSRLKMSSGANGADGKEGLRILIWYCPG